VYEKIAVPIVVIGVLIKINPKDSGRRLGRDEGAYGSKARSKNKSNEYLN
jgi:hypothetical protein